MIKLPVNKYEWSWAYPGSGSGDRANPIFLIDIYINTLFIEILFKINFIGSSAKLFQMSSVKKSHIASTNFLRTYTEPTKAIYSIFDHIWSSQDFTRLGILSIVAGLQNESDLRDTFPHYLGAIDGKHVVMRSSGGSDYFNYKHLFSSVLMALVDSNCCFVFCDIGNKGRLSYGGVFRDNVIFEKLHTNSSYFPQPGPSTLY